PRAVTKARSARTGPADGMDSAMSIETDTHPDPAAPRWAAEDELVTRRLVALVGHELRTPLASALLYLDIADRRSAAGASPTSVRSALAVARSEVRRLEQLVRRVMELERHGHAVMHPGRCDLGRVVRTAVQRAVAVSRDAQARVRVDITAGSFIGWWDAMAVEQILHNLLSNAL